MINLKDILLTYLLRFSLFFVVIFVSLCIYSPLFSSYVYALESIKDFNASVVINKDGTINIEEEIAYDFGTDSKHGIYRDIPIIKTNQEGKNFTMSLDVLDIKDKKGNVYSYVVSEENNILNIRIGDSDKYVSGLNTYIISYKVSGALTYFDTFDELYWNLTGNAWEIPIENVSINILVPMTGEELSKEGALEVVCYTGTQGSTEKNCSYDINGNVVKVESSLPLNPQEGLTFAVKFPKGIVGVLEPTPVEELSPVLISIISILVTLLFVFLYIYLPIKFLVVFIKNRRYVNKNKQIVAAWFDSPKIGRTKFSPVETVTLVTQSVNNRQITSTLIDLAHRGYLSILVKDKNDISIKLLKDYKDNKEDLRSYEKELLRILFGNKQEIILKDIKNNKEVYKILDKIKTNVFAYLFDTKLFEIGLKKHQDKYSLFILLSVITFNIPLFLVSLISLKAAKMTDFGIEKYSQALSLRNFLVSQDDQFNFQSKEQMFFEKLLPYATAFGVEKIWISRFKDLNITNPDWYQGDINYLTVLPLKINSSVSSSISSTNSSSGFSSGFSGGSSGGGGGGGGGGSW